MKPFHFIASCICFLTLFTDSYCQEPLPPVWVDVNGMLEAHWLPPAKILLDEHFEGNQTPAGWQLTSQGEGWYLADSGQIGPVVIPSYSQFYLVNDGTASAGNNGCCDYLITPSLDLSQYSGYHLSFLSFFTGYNGQTAKVEISTDDGVTWSILQSMNPDPTWRSLYIDLSAYSGPGGFSNVKLAFHANDQGSQASGWAVDDVLLESGYIEVQEYQITVNGDFVANTTETTYQFDMSNYEQGNGYECCVSAVYPTLGVSPAACDSFPLLWFIPPQNLAYTTEGDSITFTWSSLSSCFGFQYFLVFHLPDPYLLASTTDTSVTFYSTPGELCLGVSAIYDLTYYGFPGQYAESYSSNICGIMGGGFPPPFYEDWSSGQFSLNHWEAGDNWIIDELDGNEAPSVQFNPPSGKSSYESTLLSWYLDAMNLPECYALALDLDFDLRLDDPTASGTEQLEILISVGDTSFSLAEYSNSGSFDWQPIHKHLIDLAGGSTFRIVFKASGLNSGGPIHWNIDNIHVYTYMIGNPPGFEVTAHRTGFPEDDILVSWEPVPMYSVEYIMDDGSAEEYLGVLQPAEIWLGNYFPVSDAGILTKASIFMTNTQIPPQPCSVSIFDENHLLIGYSDPFTPEPDSWTTVNLPDISYDGAFYAMLHISADDTSNKVGIDTNGPNTIGDVAMIFDGNSWKSFSESGMTSGVVMVRVQGILDGDAKQDGLLDGKRPTSSTQPGNSKKADSNYENLNPLAITTIMGCDTLGYDIYRRAYSSYPPSGGNGIGEWELIGYTPKEVMQFLDQDLSNDSINCYEYSIGVVYPEGHSLPSGNGWECLYVNTPELTELYPVILFPNPADQQTVVELNSQYLSGELLDINGIVLIRARLSGLSTFRINTSCYPAGSYILRLRNKKGEQVQSKLIINH